MTQRTNEIGVRMAMGATSRDILLSFSGRGLALTVTGLVIGLVLAVMAAGLMTALLYGFEPHYGMAAAVVSVVLVIGGDGGEFCTGAACVAGGSDGCAAE